MKQHLEARVAGQELMHGGIEGHHHAIQHVLAVQRRQVQQHLHVNRGTTATESWDSSK